MNQIAQAVRAEIMRWQLSRGALSSNIAFDFEIAHLWWISQKKQKRPRST